MARQEIKKAIDSLFTEKNASDRKLTESKDLYDRYSQELAALRAEQFSYREAKEHLPNSNSHKPARQVFDKNIAECQKKMEDVLKKLDQVEKDRVVINSKKVALEKSIKELQNS